MMIKVGPSEVACKHIMEDIRSSIQIKLNNLHSRNERFSSIHTVWVHSQLCLDHVTFAEQ